MGNNITTDRRFNYQNKISLDVELDKTCFVKGEYITGYLNIKLIDGLQTNLTDPNAVFQIREYHHYNYCTGVDTDEEIENYLLLTKTKSFPNFEGSNLMNKLKIPFQIQVPSKAYPTCNFSLSNYVHHFLSVDFPSIEAKKTVGFVIKNNPYFTKENRLLLSPAVYFKEMKIKSFFSDKGSYKASLKLPTNKFAYEQKIPFEIDIDATNLKVKLKKVEVCITRVDKKNSPIDHSHTLCENEKIITKRTIPLLYFVKKYHIEDDIKLQSEHIFENPNNVYKMLDSDKRNFTDKIFDIELYPSCNGGILSCQYKLVLFIYADTFFYIPHKIEIPIDLYGTSENFTPGCPEREQRNIIYDINNYDAPNFQEFKTVNGY